MESVSGIPLLICLISLGMTGQIGKSAGNKNRNVAPFVKDFFSPVNGERNQRRKGGNTKMSSYDEWPYQSDVAYEVWVGGGRVDAIDRDLISECIRSGRRVETAADIELKRQRRWLDRKML